MHKRESMNLGMGDGRKRLFPTALGTNFTWKKFPYRSQTPSGAGIVIMVLRQVLAKLSHI